MRDNSKPVAAAEQSTDVIADTLAELLKTRNKGMAAFVMFIVLGVTLGIASALYFESVEITLAFIILTPIAAFAGLDTYIKGLFRTKALPLIAKDVGLSHSGNNLSYDDLEKRRVIPQGSVRSFQDNLHGTIANVPFVANDVTISTGGKNSKTLFRGLVVRFDQKTDLPHCLVVEKPSELNRIFSKRLSEAESLWVQQIDWHSNAGIEYRIYTNQSSVKPIQKRINDIALNVEKGQHFNTLYVDSNSVHLSISSKRDLFLVGGLMTNQNKIQQNVIQTYTDISWMMDLLKHFPPKN